MSIVGVYKEIQDQHMNIVSIIMMKEQMKNEHSIYSWWSLVIFTVESFLRGFVGAVGDELGAWYEGRAGKIHSIVALYYHILTNKLLQINFKQLYLISSGFLTYFLPKTNWIIFGNFVFVNLFFFGCACAYSCDLTSFNQNHPTITTSNTCAATDDAAAASGL